MGIQGSDIRDVTNVTGASVLVIEQACENSQLLVNLSRNGKEWLSPVGWTTKQKITLLDCRSYDGKTEVDIPAEFSNILVTGDKLVLKCSELDLTQEVIWESSNQQTRPVADITPAAGLTGGLFSRFKSIKSSEVPDLKSEAQLRAEEADLAAETYRVKMEVATAAKEDAHRRSLEASREAEAALKMEAERIADMERAAKAFEEAERLKQDGLRRVEEERRQEKARIAEENRRIEDALKREEAAKLEAERKAALGRHETALDLTLNEETRLQTRLTRLKAEAGDLDAQQTEQTALLLSLQDNLGAIQNRVGTARDVYEKTASKLERLNSDLIGLQSKSDSLSTESADIGTRVARVEAEYLTAQKEAEMAIAYAEEKRAILVASREENDAILNRLNSVSEKLETHSALVSETTLKTQKLESKFEANQADLSNKSMDIEALENGTSNILDSIQTRRVEIEATQQAVEDCRARQSTHQTTIAHLQAGGNLNDVHAFDMETRLFSNDENDYSSLNADEVQSSPSKATGLFGRVRRNFSRNKDEISVELEDIHLDEDLDLGVEVEDLIQEEVEDDKTFVVETVSEQFEIEDIIAEPALKTTGFARRHSKSLLAIGTILGGAVILGGSFLISQADQPSGLTVKKPTPAATKSVNSAKTAASTKTKDIAIKDLAIKVPTVLPIETSVVSGEEANVTQFDIPDITVPNLTLTGLSMDNVPAVLPVKSKTVFVKKPLKKTLKKVKKTKAVPTVEKPINYPELTTRVQTQLQTLGFYLGGLNGEQSTETTVAIKTFQEQYSLPIHGRISGKFLTVLYNAEAQYKQNQKNIVIREIILQNNNAPLNVETPQLASASFSAPVFYDTVKAIPNQVVITDTLQTVEPPEAIRNDYVVRDVTAPIITAPTISSVIEAAPDISTATPSQVVPPVQDIVVEAQRTRPVKASYPKAALARNYLVDVRILVGYDIDPFGKVVNLSILGNDHSGRFNSAFERAARVAVKKQRFTAKTVNGLPVATIGQQQSVAFKGQ